jgi:hypothetical protein
MAQTFGVNVRTINEHLQNIFKTKELDENSTFWKIRIVQNEGNHQVEREVKFYNLDAIISVGYRVNSKEATQFRIWATNILKDYIVQGFAIDVELLKNGTRLGKDYFKKLLDIIKDIRLSERRLYEQVTDIYATSYDYNKDAKITKNSL